MANSRRKKKFYAVRSGAQPGIYLRWDGPGGAAAQVQGYPGARYRSFASRELAEAWLRGEEVVADRRAVVTPPADADVLLYTDGGCLNNPGPGGFGAVIIRDGARQEISGGFRKTTNNRMELLACIRALEALAVGEKADLYSDSSYVVNGMSRGWLKSWRARKWCKASGDPVENADLWDRLAKLAGERSVRFHWIKGHAQHAENERCDRLARQGASEGCGIDVNYERGTTAGVPAVEAGWQSG